MHFNVYYLEALFGLILAVSSIIKWVLDSHKKTVRESVHEILNEEFMEQIKATVATSVSEAIHPQDVKIAVIEDRTDAMWAQFAYGAANVLHHPEPSRAGVDVLLDKFLEHTLTEDEAEELRGYLRTIRDWEPGTEAPFKIFDGEQVAASILLSTMDHVIAGDK